LVLGTPAKVTRPLNAEERTRLEQSAAHYVWNFRRYVSELGSEPA
jgi:carbonic anhydrase/acetyltransferase-like protein (isoleucine patch superfamily)